MFQHYCRYHIQVKTGVGISIKLFLAVLITHIIFIATSAILPSDVPGRIEMLPASGSGDNGTVVGTHLSVAAPGFCTLP